MSKKFEEMETVNAEVVDERTDIEVSVDQKKSLWTKTKETVKAIPDMTLRDAGKAVGKVILGGAGIGGVVYGVIKIFGSNGNDIDVVDLDDLRKADDLFDDLEQEESN